MVKGLEVSHTVSQTLATETFVCHILQEDNL